MPDKIKRPSAAPFIALTIIFSTVFIVGMGLDSFTYYIDRVAIIFLTLLIFSCMIFTLGFGGTAVFVKTTLKLITHSPFSGNYTVQELKIAHKGAKTSIWTSIIGGIIGDYIGLINMLHSNTDFSSEIGKTGLAIMLLTSLFGLLGALLMWILKNRIEFTLENIEQPPANVSGLSTVITIISALFLLLILTGVIAATYNHKQQNNTIQKEPFLYNTAKSAITNKKEDKFSYTGKFIDNPQAHGKWIAVDFVHKPVEFRPDFRNYKTELYLKELTLHPDGTTDRKWKIWTENYLLHTGVDKSASNFSTGEIKGNTYMFLEWLSGDVLKRGQPPKYYVLKKVK